MRRRAIVLPPAFGPCAVAPVIALISLISPARAGVITGGGCVDEVSGRSNNCTATDVIVVELGPGTQTDGCVGPSDTVTVFFRGVLRNTVAQTRYDVGLYLATDGDPNLDGAKSGICTRATIEPVGGTGVTTCGVGALDLDGPLSGVDGNVPGLADGPFARAETGAAGSTPDACGDLYPAGQAGCDEDGNGLWDDTVLDLPVAVTLPCEDADADRFVDVPTCTTWGSNPDEVSAAGGGATCDSDVDVVPGTASKCGCQRMVTGIPVPALSCSASCSPTSISPGGSTQCTVTYTNSVACAPDGGTPERFRCGTAGYLRFRTEYDESAGAISAIGTSGVGGGGMAADVEEDGDRRILWTPSSAGSTAGIVGPGESATLSFTYTATTAGATFVTTASWSDDPSFTTEVVQSALTCSALVSPGALVLTKSDGGAATVPGGGVSYTLTAGNVSGAAVPGVTITETVPANAGFDPLASSPGWACVPDGSAGSTCTLGLGALAAGAQVQATFAVVVDDPVPAGTTQITNGASLDAPSVPTAAAADGTPVDARLDLAVAVADQGLPTRPGGTIAYTVSWENVGTQSASGVVVADTVPAGTTFDAAGSDPGWSCLPDGGAGSTCTRALGGLAAGAGGSAVFAVAIDDPLAPGLVEIENEATIADDGSLGADVTPGDDAAVVLTAVDREAPAVSGVDTVPPAGGIAPCGQLAVAPSALAVSFEDVLSAIEGAGELANYLLVAPGPDGDLSTTSCGAVAGDDVAATIDGVAVAGDPKAPTATLSLATPLADGIHLLLVCDAIADAAGNALDGDGDGSVGGHLGRRFRVDRDNLFVNAHFDDCPEAPLGVPPWSHDAETPDLVAATLDADVESSPLSGALELSSTSGGSLTVDQCVELAGPWDHRGGAAALAALGTSPVEVTLWCAFSTAAACADLQAPLILDSVTVAASPSPWTPLAGWVAPPAGATSARCGLVTAVPGGSPHHVYLDQLFFAGPLVFADGFESGDTSAWTWASPP